MLKKRRQRGATMGMVAAVTIVFVLLGVFVIFLVKLLGGGEQMQRSSDSGNLQLTRAELDQFTTPVPSSGDGQQFNGASDHSNSAPGGNGNIDLRNVNSVQGQAFLVNVNAYIMSQQGVDNGSTTHAQQTSNAAHALTSALATSMANATNAFNSYTAVSRKMPTEEFGFSSTTSAGGPKFSYLDRGLPSNVYVNPESFADYNFTTQQSPLYQAQAANWTGTVSSATDNGANHYMLGYVDGMTPSPTFPNTYFVPLRPGARPHLVSKAVFDANSNPQQGTSPFQWNLTQAVGNAVSQGAIKKDSEAGFAQFAAYGQMEPIDPNGVPMSIHHGFIRIQNGAPSPASGFAAGNSQDVFVFTMNDPQYYPTSTSGPMPYFVGQNDSPLPYGASSPQDYMTKLLAAIKAGSTPDCTGFSVGYALAGDTIGLGGVSAANCAKITGLAGGTTPTVINNIDLAQAGSTPNSDMHTYNSSDLLGYYARPLIEAAYNLQPAQATGSNGQSVSVGDIINLALLSARAQGQNFTVTAGQYNSGIAYIPPNRSALKSPNYKIAAQPEAASLQSQVNGTVSNQQGIVNNGKIWQFLAQRFTEIDPTWTAYCPGGNVDMILNQAQIPMAGRGIIYYSSTGNGGKGGLVLKEQSAAIADAPWLSSFIAQTADGRAPTSPTEVKEFKLVADTDTSGNSQYGMIDVDEDWGFPHPYDNPPNISILNWFSYTPSSGYNNLLGELNVGAVNTYGTTPSGGSSCPPTGSSYTLNSGAGAGGSDTVTLPNGPCSTITIGTGPC